MQKVNLNDVIGHLDDKIIEKAIETDNAQKLKELKKIEKKKGRVHILKCFSIFSSCAAVFVLGVIILNNRPISDDNVLIPNPVTEISNLSELSSYLGLDVTKLDIKPIEEIYIFSGETLGEIKYQDNSALRIGVENNDISGTYGGTLVEEISIKDIKIQIKKMENTNYATWKNNNYSYSYIKADKENLKEMVTKIIERMN